MQALDGVSEEFECRLIGPYEFVEFRVGDRGVREDATAVLMATCARDS